MSSRRIYCPQCALNWALDTMDIGMGIQARVHWVRLGEVPPIHRWLAILEYYYPMPEVMSSVVCDLCGTNLAPGEVARAITTWNPNHLEGEPDCWETQFGEIEHE